MKNGLQEVCRDPRAEPEVIKAAYRRLAAKYHPDINPSPETMERMKLLNAAYDVLSDPMKRKEHDVSRLHGRQQTREETSTTHLPWRFWATWVGIQIGRASGRERV